MGKKYINPLTVAKNIYNNEFQWMLVKSYGMFFLSVRLAKEFVGIDIMPHIAPN